MTPSSKACGRIRTPWDTVGGSNYRSIGKQIQSLQPATKEEWEAEGDRVCLKRKPGTEQFLKFDLELQTTFIFVSVCVNAKLTNFLEMETQMQCFHGAYHPTRSFPVSQYSLHSHYYHANFSPLKFSLCLSSALLISTHSATTGTQC